MAYTLTEIAAALDGHLVGSGDTLVERVARPDEAKGPEDMALAMDRESLAALAETKAIAAIVADEAAVPEGRVMSYIQVRRPRYAMSTITTLFDRPVTTGAGVHPTAFVEESATLGKAVCVGPFAYVGHDARIGDGSILLAHVSVGAGARMGAGCLVHPGVRIGDRVILGDRVIVHHNASIGADGFSFVTPDVGSVETAKASGRVDAKNTSLVRINSIGTVEIGDDVEIGACTAIDRGTVSATRVGNNTKIDDLVLIGHNVSIGANCMICGQVGIAGSATIGDRVVLAGQVGVADHLTIGDDVVVGAGSGVAWNLAPNSVVLGYPAVPKAEAAENVLNIRRLGRMYNELKSLKKRVKDIESGPERR